MNADCAHLSEQPGLLGCSLFMRQKAARGYTLQKEPMVRMCEGICKPAHLVIALGPRQKIIPPLACLMARLLRYIHPHVSRYAQLDVPCRQTIIRRNRVELFLTVTLNQKRQPRAITRG